MCILNVYTVYKTDDKHIYNVRLNTCVTLLIHSLKQTAPHSIPTLLYYTVCAALLVTIMLMTV